MMKNKILFALLVVLCGTVGWWLWPTSTTTADRAAPAARPIIAAFPRLQPLSETALLTGTAEANASVEIRPEIAGRITEILFTEGALLPANTPLVKLDARSAEARRDEMKAELLSAEQQISRARALREGAVVTAARLDELKAELEGARARLREAEVAVDQHTIKMPFDGVVGLRRVSVGAQVTSADILTTADDSTKVNVVMRVPDVWLAAIKPGLPVVLVSSAGQALNLSGSITAIDSRVEAGSRTIAVKAQIDNPKALVKPGSLVSVELPLAKRPEALVIPEQALQVAGTQQAVFVVEEGKAKRRTVTTGLRQRGLVEVTSGLTVGLPVIASGADRLRSDAPVAVAEVLEGWAEGAAPAAAPAAE